jgi:hypothetical protein
MNLMRIREDAHLLVSSPVKNQIHIFFFGIKIE